jgi:hypothetical protein
MKGIYAIRFGVFFAGLLALAAASGCQTWQGTAAPPLGGGKAANNKNGTKANNDPLAPQTPAEAQVDAKIEGFLGRIQ